MIKKFILSCLLTLTLGSVAGQVASRTLQLPFKTKNDVLIDFCNPVMGSLSYFRDKNTNKNVFVCTQHFFSLMQNWNQKYVIPSFSSPTGPIVYTVNDMKVIGDKCFICGKKSVPVAIHNEIGGGQTYICEDYGYIAKLYLDSIHAFFHSNIRCLHAIIDGTSDLTKMDITLIDNDTLIGIIGRTNENPDYSCLVSITGTTSSWNYSVAMIENASEVLTDIAINENKLSTVSRFNSDNYSFGIRNTSNYELFYCHQHSSYSILNKFNTAGMAEATTSNFSTWHRDNATIRLMFMPGTNDLTVAHECHYYYSPSHYNSSIALYYINNTASPAMQQSAFFYIFVPYEDGVDMFQDMLCIPDNNGMVFLTKHPGYAMKSSVYRAFWNNYSGGTRLTSNTVTATSMYVDNNNYIRMAGADYYADGTIFNSLVDVSWIDGTCHDGDTFPLEPLEFLPSNVLSISQTPTNIFNQNVIWNDSVRVTPEGFEYEIHCTDYNNRTNQTQQQP